MEAPYGMHSPHCQHSDDDPDQLPCGSLAEARKERLQISDQFGEDAAVRV